jgi:hypothetical protein
MATARAATGRSDHFSRRPFHGSQVGGDGGFNAGASRADKKQAAEALRPDLSAGRAAEAFGPGAQHVLSSPEIAVVG